MEIQLKCFNRSRLHFYKLLMEHPVTNWKSKLFYHRMSCPSLEPLTPLSHQNGPFSDRFSTKHTNRSLCRTDRACSTSQIRVCRYHPHPRDTAATALSHAAPPHLNTLPPLQLVRAQNLHFVSVISFVGDQTNRALSLTVSGLLSGGGTRSGHTAW